MSSSQAHPPDGYEFTIRTPGTPHRWKGYDEELRSLWGELTEAICMGEEDMDHVSDLVLSIYYYWVNFGPLSRGSAACGLIVLYALFLAVGMKINCPIKPGMQIDWEAILRPDLEDFLAVMRPWMYPNLEAFVMQEHWPDVSKALPTPRMTIRALATAAS